MSTPKDGGSAFPEIFTDTPPGSHDLGTYSAGGMSLRAYLAAKTMQGIVGAEWSAGTNRINPKSVAAEAVKYADALLAELAKGAA